MESERSMNMSNGGAVARERDKWEEEEQEKKRRYKLRREERHVDRHKERDWRKKK